MKITKSRETAIAGGGVLALLLINSLLGSSTASWVRTAAGVIGMLFLLALAVLLSENRRSFPVKTVLAGLGLQIFLAAFMIYTPVGRDLFHAVGSAFAGMLNSASKANETVFGPALSSPAGPVGFVLAIQIFATIVFMGALSRMLYHLGVLQQIVRAFAWAMRRVMGISGAESLASASNVFTGMVESSLTIRPYVAGMTRSELFTVMSAGMATVAGSVMMVYASILRPVLGDNAAGHLLTASVMSAPAAIMFAKIMIPETETPQTGGDRPVPKINEGETRPINLMDAASRGAIEGMHLALAVVALLVAFIALVSLADGVIAFLSAGNLTFSQIVGGGCSPIAVGMGIPLNEALTAGELIGTKTVLNEFVAYDNMSRMDLSPGTSLVMSYALCGFANLGSVAIMIAGIGGIAPNQRPRLAKLGLLSIVSGSLAAFMTGCLIGVLS